MKKLALLGLGLAALCLAGCLAAVSGDFADALYFGGEIVTRQDGQPNAEAVAVKDGRILSVGTLVDLEKSYRGPTTAMVNLDGKTMMPASVIDTKTALQVLMRDTAWQDHEEGDHDEDDHEGKDHEAKERGAIEAGELADLVILNANPLTAETDAVKNIQVIETIKEGETVYKAP